MEQDFKHMLELIQQAKNGQVVDDAQGEDEAEVAEKHDAPPKEPPSSEPPKQLSLF